MAVARGRPKKRTKEEATAIVQEIKKAAMTSGLHGLLYGRNLYGRYGKREKHEWMPDIDGLEFISDVGDSSITAFRHIAGTLMCPREAGVCIFPEECGVDSAIPATQKTDDDVAWGSTLTAVCFGSSPANATGAATPQVPVTDTVVFKFPDAAFRSTVRAVNFFNVAQNNALIPQYSYLLSSDPLNPNYAFPAIPSPTVWDGGSNIKMAIQRLDWTGNNLTGNVPNISTQYPSTTFPGTATPGAGSWTSNWEPHEGYLWCGRAGYNKYFWVDASNSTGYGNGVNIPARFTIWNTAAVPSNSQVCVQLWQWFGPSGDIQGPCGLITASTAANTATYINIPSSGYYRVELALQASGATPPTYPAGGQFQACITCYTPFAWKHMAIPDILSILGEATSVAGYGSTLLMTDVANFLNAGGKFYAGQARANTDWFLGLVTAKTTTTVAKAIRIYPRSDTLPAIEGGYGIHHPRTLKQFMQGEFGQIFLGGAGGGVSDVGFDISTPYGFLMCAASVPTQVANQAACYFCMSGTNSMSYRTNKNSAEENLPWTSQHAWISVVHAMRMYPLFTSNPSHLASIGRFLSKGGKIAAGVLGAGAAASTIAGIASAWTGVGALGIPIGAVLGAGSTLLSYGSYAVDNALSNN
jgi:hypothetical protein